MKLHRNRQRERAEQEALFIRMSVRMERAMAKELAKSYKAAASAVEHAGLFAIGPAVRANSAPMARTLAASYASIATAFGKRMGDGMKSFYPAYRKDFGVTFDDLLTHFLQDWTATRIKQIDATTEEQVRRIVQRTLEEGLTLVDASKAIREAAPSMSLTRAHIIARTEAHTAANAGQQFEAEASEFEMAKEWISAQDDRTRTDPFDHLAEDGQTAEKTGFFIIGGEELAYPGDPNGSPGNIINCRCALGWEIK